MRPRPGPLILLLAVGSAQGEVRDPRLREVTYDPGTVVSVPVRRGVVTHVELADDEAITHVGAGLGGDCARSESVWCIAAQPGGRHLFVKPKSGAEAANNVAVVTDRRAYAIRFVVLPDRDPRTPVYRLVIRPPRPAEPARPDGRLQLPPPPVVVMPVPTPSSPAPARLEDRLQAAPELRNSDYTIAEGDASTDIVPTLVFDDGRFTYVRFPGNREVPAVFHVQGDGSEAVVNTRMEGDLLVVDRVSRRLVLRAGQAVVGVWNEAFDLDGVPPDNGTTVPGVQRRVRQVPAAPDALGRSAEPSSSPTGGGR